MSAFGSSLDTLSQNEFIEFRSFLKEAAGIDLADNKQYLVTTRIRRILVDNKLASLNELTAKIKQPAGRNLRQQVIDAMTTNETFWFRDIYPFEYLKNTIFPELKNKKAAGATRIWSAACSSGQEPYSISICADEYIKSAFGAASFPLEIQATDLSTAILEKAKAGVYDRLSIGRGMSDQRLKQHFESQADGSWALKANIKQRVKFRSLNLQDSYLMLGKFDIVFCRNVLIYFSADLKQDILRRIRGVMNPGAYLFLGSSESLGGASAYFDMVHCKPGVVYVAK